MLPAWVLPAPSLLNDPPAMKALCNFEMHSLAIHLACFSKTEVFCVQLWRRCAESNMQTGQDYEICRKPWLFGRSLYVWVEDFNQVKPGSHEV